MKRSPFEPLRAVALAVLVALSACVIARADAPIGSLELIEAEGVRVKSLYEQDFEGNSYRRYDAPQGSTFLVVRLDAKAIWGVDDGGRACVSLPREAVSVSGKGWSAPASGMLDLTGHLETWDWVRRYADEERPDLPVHFDFAFAIPENAKQATITAGNLTKELRLAGKVLPRLDWRDFMKVTIRRAYSLDTRQRESGQFDTISSIDYRWNIAYAKENEPLVAVEFVVEPLRGNAEGEPSPLEIDQTDFRLDYAGEQGTLPIAMISEVAGGFGPPQIFDVDDVSRGFERDEQGALQPKELVHVYRFYGPAEKVTLTYFGAPVGEIEIDVEPQE